MRHGSLFSGIGGFDLAAQWMGWENVFHCEWNEFGQRTLKYYWPKATSYNDIRTTDFTIHRGSIDILTGGFPCQPYSTAGKRKGKEDDRHLWPEMLRAIREIQPSWVVGENVRGLTNWNGGMVFDEVQADLEAEGYEVTPFLLPACAVNAPHRRDRIWFVAYSEGNNDKRNTTTVCGANELEKEERPEERVSESGSASKWNVTDSSNAGIESMRSELENTIHGFTPAPNANQLNGNIPGFRTGQISQHETPRIQQNITDTTGNDGRVQERPRKIEFGRSNWNWFPTQSPLCGGNDGLPRELDGITFSKWRNESLKGYGNAIVPPVALEIFKAIERL